jgi:hypothetical protein
MAGQTYNVPLPFIPTPEEADELVDPEQQAYDNAKMLLRSVLTVPEKDPGQDDRDDIPWGMSAYDYLMTDFPRYASHRDYEAELLKVAAPAILEGLRSALSPVVSATRLAGKSLAGIGGVVAKPIKKDPLFFALQGPAFMDKMHEVSGDSLEPHTPEWSKE